MASTFSKRQSSQRRNPESKDKGGVIVEIVKQSTFIHLEDVLGPSKGGLTWTTHLGFPSIRKKRWKASAHLFGAEFLGRLMKVFTKPFNSSYVSPSRASEQVP